MAEQDPRKSGRMSAEEAAQLGEEIASLTRAGLPLPSGLRALGAELPAGRLRQLIDSLSESLERGMSLEAALSAPGARLPAHLGGLVRAGERTGRTGEVLGRFAEFARVGVEVRRLLWLNLAYPIIALGLAIAVLVFVLTYIVGGFQQIFMDFGIPIPVLTMFLIECSTAVRTYGPRLAGGLGTLGAVLALVLIVIGPAARRSVAARVPILGPVWRWTTLAEFFHLLGLLLESEIPLVEAVAMAGDGVQDRDVRIASRSLTRGLEGGDSMAVLMERQSFFDRQSFFPEGLGPIVAWAERHDCLAGTLHMLAEMYEGRARAQASFSSTVFSVTTVLAILCGIAAVIVGVMLPMIQLINVLSG